MGGPPGAGHFAELGTLRAPGLGARRVRAYVPADAATAPRPLVILFDGQNVFDDVGSFAGGWHTHAAVDARARTHRRPAPIVLGVDHGGAARIAELTPFTEGGRGGHLDGLLDAIVDVLVPHARARFALRADAAGLVIGGASLGGLAALYAHLRRPEVFGAAIAMSPSLWFARDALATFAAAQPVPPRSRVYLDAGAREGGGRAARLTASFAAALGARGWGAPAARGARRVMLRRDPRGRHDERAWRRRFPTALRFALAA